MRLKTDFVGCALLLAICVASGLAQQPVKDQTPLKQAGGAQAGHVPETEAIPPPQPAQATPPVDASGFMDPAQVKALAHKIWLAEYRINDLLTQVRPEKWKMSNVARNSFSQTLENLHRGLEGLEEWRAQFEKRPESMYFGFQTYMAMNAALPRLDGVARATSQFENASLGAQYSQAGDQLFDLQQALQPYLVYLLRTTDQFLYAAQTNLAGCQNELGKALRGQGGRAKPLKNTFVELHGRRHSGGQPEDRRPAGVGKQKSAGKSAKKAESQSQSQPH
jgi:hypothetical protein